MRSGECLPGLGRVSTNNRDGFLAHYSLCLAPDGDPLGCLELFAWSRLDEKKRSKAYGLTARSKP